MYKYASAEFFRKEHTLRKATAPREAGDEVNGPSPTAGWGAVDSGHSHVWVTDVRGGGAAGDGAPWNTGPRGGDGGRCFRRGSPAGPLRALPAPASSLPPTPPATVGPPHTEPLRIQRDALRPPSDLVRPRWPHVRPCPRRALASLPREPVALSAAACWGEPVRPASLCALCLGPASCRALGRYNRPQCTVPQCQSRRLS